MMQTKSTPETSYLAEISAFLETAAQEDALLSESYFLQLAAAYFQPPHPDERKLFVLGTGIPEEWFAAMQLSPTYILGGSLSALQAANADVPRDTDAVSQSMLGYLKLPCFMGANAPVVVVPMVNDSLRKIVQQLQQRNVEVIGVDLLCVTDVQRIGEQFTPVLLSLADTLCARFSTRFSRRRLQNAYAAANSARLAFESVRRRLRGSTSMLLANSYCYTNDRERWHRELLRLAEGAAPQDSRPTVCLMGSPIFAPNFKIPYLIEKSGLTIAYHYQAMFRPVQNAPLPHGREMVKSCAEGFYTDLYSPSRIDRTRMETAFRTMLREVRPDGIVYVVFKGHIGADFDLPLFEAAAEELELPLIRLETDYYNNDMEQLRIRLEAFSEILRHKVRTKGKDHA